MVQIGSYVFNTMSAWKAFLSNEPDLEPALAESQRLRHAYYALGDWVASDYYNRRIEEIHTELYARKYR